MLERHRRMRKERVCGLSPLERAQHLLQTALEDELRLDTVKVAIVNVGGDCLGDRAIGGRRNRRRLGPKLAQMAQCA